MIDHTIRRRGIPAVAPDLDREPPEWAASALCTQIGDDMFFPAKGGSTRPAKTICGRCDVRADCLALAMTTEDTDRYRFGVYGGLSLRERTLLHRSGWRPGDITPAIVDPYASRRKVA